MLGIPHYHKKVTKMTINLKKLGGFKKDEQLVFILAHLRDISMTYPKEAEKLAEKFPVIKDMPKNHNFLHAEIYETIFNQQSFAENHDAHYGREIQKIGDAIERITAACYKEKAKMLGGDKTILDMERELAKSDKETLHVFEDPSEETSAHIKEMDLTKDEEHVTTGKKGKAKRPKAAKTPKDSKSEAEQMKELEIRAKRVMPLIMIPKKPGLNPNL